MGLIQVAPGLAIDETDIEEKFVHASGPGGQNVNKVATAVELRFASHSLPAEVRARLQRLAGRRLTEDGVLVLRAGRFRTQERNRADARARLADLILRAATPPVLRRPTRPNPAAKRRRLEEKAMRSATKRGRSRPRGDES